jgi:hypothetical protein
MVFSDNAMEILLWQAILSKVDCAETEFSKNKSQD